MGKATEVVAVEEKEEKKAPPIKKQDDINSALRKLSTALEARYNASKSIKREGKSIILPETMSLPEAARVISAEHQRMEEEVETQQEFECNPDDGMVCFHRAVSEVFGELSGSGQDLGFKGKVPGRSKTIPISFDDEIVVPIGDADIPGLPIKMRLIPNANPHSDLGGTLVVVFHTQRKYEPVIKEIIRLTKDKLKNDSIYKGKAINSRFAFLNLSGFDPNRVIYSKEDERKISASVLEPIRHTDRWRKAGSPLKRGILLYGDYGTGKTLTALYTAYECIQHNWTFINVVPGDDFARALRIAKRYAPAVVFFEDIDQDVEGARDHDLNEILNTVDGVVSKNDEVMVVLTTNHKTKINPAMLRPGRLDHCIMCGTLDDYAVEKLLRTAAQDKFGDSMIMGDLNMAAIMEAADGYSAAFITESVVRAKAYALARSDGDEWAITGDDIIMSLKELRPQYDMMMGNHIQPRDNLQTMMEGLVRKVLMEQRVMTDEDVINAIEALKEDE